MSRPLIAALVVLFSVPARAEDEKVPGPKIKWPEVEGLTRQTPNVFKERDLGYAVSYFGEKTSLSVIVHVYNRGRDKIPAGTGSDAVKAEMLDSLNAIEGFRAEGQYKTLAPVGDAVIAPGGKGGAEFRRRRYEVTIAKQGEGITELYVTAFQNHFVKVRTTYLDKDRDACEKQVTKFLEGLAGELK
jgi:hypothetical protein